MATVLVLERNMKVSEGTIVEGTVKRKGFRWGLFGGLSAFFALLGPSVTADANMAASAHEKAYWADVLAPEACEKPLRIYSRYNFKKGTQVRVKIVPTYKSERAESVYKYELVVDWK